MVAASYFTSLKMLLWKNWLLQIRRPIGTVAELVIPTLLFFLLWALRVTITITDYPDTVYCSAPVSFLDGSTPMANAYFGWGGNPEQDNSDWSCQNSPPSLNNLFNASVGGSHGGTYNAIAYAPNTDPGVTAVMARFSDVLQYYLGLTPNYVGYADPSDFNNLASDSANNYLLAIGFYQDASGAMGAPGLDPNNRTHYVLRMPEDLASGNGNDGWQTNRLFPAFIQLGPNFNAYYQPSQGYVPFQTLVDTALISHALNSSMYNAFLRVKPMPWPAYTKDPFVFAISDVLPLILVFAFIYSASSITRTLVYEKEKRLKEAMKMMGLSSPIHWLAWFIKSFLFLLVSIIIITGIFVGAGIAKYSNPGVVFVLLLLYILSIIFFCFMLSTWFSKSNVAAAAGALLFFCSFIPYLFMENNVENIARSQQAAACLLAPTCIGIGMYILSLFETSGQGLKFGNLTTYPTELDTFTMADVFGMLILDCVLYWLICWYIENVFPGEYGTPKPFYFFLLPSYWCPRRAKVLRDDAATEDTGIDPRFFEQAPPNMHSGVKIEKLRKTFKAETGGTKVAVQGLSLNMYENQITALLGHNGAGKSTTISMLVGLFPPTSGTALVNDCDIVEDIEGVRGSLGLCPQFDVLFDTLTVEEHILFFARLKGCSVAEARKEVDWFVKEIDLPNKQKAQIRTLSGGQKRALSCAIALCGGSKVVILDEPTSGMDPYKRRRTWDLLLRHKEGRTILLTTHFMEEADILGDRIAIMAEGQLRTVGSPMFLKDRFGVGYHLTVVKQSGCEAEAVVGVVKKYVPEADPVQDVGTELTLLLPKDAAPNFPPLFQTLEAQRGTLRIESYGVSMTTMEEVFLKVTSGDLEKTTRSDNSVPRKRSMFGAELDASFMVKATVQRSSGLGLRWRQFMAMLTKRYLYFLRNKTAVVTQLILPLIFALAAILIARYGSTPSTVEDQLLFSLQGYESNTVRVSINDSAGDVWSYVDPTGASLYAGAAQDGPSTQVPTIATQINYLLQNDPRFTSASTFSELHSANISSILLEAAVDYNKNLFYRNNIASFQLQPGPYVIRSNTGSSVCEVWNGQAFVSGVTLQLSIATTHRFLLQPGGSSLSLEDASHTTQNAYQDNHNSFSCTSSPCLAGLYNAGSNKVSGLLWYLNSSLVTSGSTYYLACGNGLTPLTLQVVAEGTDFTDPGTVDATAFYSEVAVHAMPQSVNLLANALARAYLGNNASIYTYNQPLPKTSSTAMQDLSTSSTGFSMALMLIFSTGFLLASVALFVVAERMSKAKHIQYVSGVSAWVYWSANYTWDLLTCVVPAIGVVVIFAIFDEAAYSDGNRLGIVFLYFVLMAWAGIPLVYLAQHLFSTPAGAYAVLSIIFIIGGLAILVAVFVTVALSEDSASKSLRYAFYWFPNYSFGQALYDMWYNQQLQSYCDQGYKSVCSSVESNYLAFHMYGVALQGIYMAAAGPVFFVLLLLYDAGWWPKCAPRAFNGPVEPRTEDDDVQNERLRVESGHAKDDLLVVRDLTKVYRKKGSGLQNKGRFMAVDHLTFGVHRGECFGLLGVNGAGKTTTFTMLTAEDTPTLGELNASGFDLRQQRAKARQLMGYCPQYDALIGLLTGREHLAMFARLRGVPEGDVGPLVAELIRKLDLTQHADKPAHTYSGGNKRKLSTAIALIGDPPLVLLDEPTTGMDPGARRFLWGVLNGVVANGQSVILTSHSMEECETLCHRISIMVNGRFRCIGSAGHLKNKYGKGYMLYAKLPPNTDNSVADTSALKRFIEENFVGATVQEEYNGGVTYKVIDEDRGWAYMFNALEVARKRFKLEDYGLSQTSLEQVFIQFAATQHDDELEREGVYGPNTRNLRVTVL